jgi:hypothetical protein
MPEGRTDSLKLGGTNMKMLGMAKHKDSLDFYIPVDFLLFRREKTAFDQTTLSTLLLITKKVKL